MSYSKKILKPNEHIVLYSRLSKIIFLRPIIILMFVILFAFVNIPGFVLFNFFILLTGIILMIDTLITYYTTEISITNMRVIYKIGLIRIKSNQITLSLVESRQLNQSIIGRLFNYGTIDITGAGNDVIHIDYVKHPLDIIKH